MVFSWLWTGKTQQKVCFFKTVKLPDNSNINKGTSWLELWSEFSFCLKTPTLCGWVSSVAEELHPNSTFYGSILSSNLKLNFWINQDEHRQGSNHRPLCYILKFRIGKIRRFLEFLHWQGEYPMYRLVRFSVAWQDWSGDNLHMGGNFASLFVSV